MVTMANSVLNFWRQLAIGLVVAFRLEASIPAEISRAPWRNDLTISNTMEKVDLRIGRFTVSERTNSLSGFVLEAWENSEYLVSFLSFIIA